MGRSRGCLQVIVFFGRAEVLLGRGRGVLRARYGGGCLQRFGPFQVRRSRWFRLPQGRLEPYDATMNGQLTAAYERLAAAKAGGTHF